MFLLRDKLITQGEKRETSSKTCNETMLRDKLRVFVSRISPPLVTFISKTILDLPQEDLMSSRIEKLSDRAGYEVFRGRKPAERSTKSSLRK